MEEEKEKSANIKSNNPHLAGGERHILLVPVKRSLFEGFGGFSVP